MRTDEDVVEDMRSTRRLENMARRELGTDSCRIGTQVIISSKEDDYLIDIVGTLR